MKRHQLLTLAAIVIAVDSFGQIPVIAHVDKYVEGPSRRITLAGSNFGTVQSDIRVHFGAQEGTIVSVADKVVEVNVPPGATLVQISLTNTLARRTAYSAQQFQVNYGGEHPFSTAKLTTPQEDFAGQSGLFDFCLCDFDEDGKTDAAATSGTNLISLFRNTSPSASDIAFDITTLSIGAKSLHIKCGDLNGDGKKDLVISEADPGERIFVLTNTSTAGSFSFTQQIVTFPGKLPKQIEIIDLDLDGRPEVIVTDQRNVNKNVLLLRNTSTGAAITFAAATSIAIPATGNASSDAIAVHDLNFDNRPEIIVTQFLTANGNVFIFKNESSQGTLKFEDVTTLNLAGATAGLRVGDLNGDGKPEIAATQLFTSSVIVFGGQSTESEISFGEGVSFGVDMQPWGIDFGDLDGDGKAEIIVACLNTSKQLSFLTNTSTAGTLSFAAKQTVTTGHVNRHVRIGDVSGDGKPDVAFASVDHDEVGAASMISTLRNTGCIVPTITPPGPVAICSTFPIALEASASAGATYQWKKNGSNIGTASSYTPTAPGDVGTFSYTVDITSDGCTKTSTATSAQVIVVGSLPAPTMSEDSPVCKDATLTIGAVSAGAEGYQWTGPAGFTASGTSVTRSAFQAEFAGRYEVNVILDGCVAQKGFVIAEMITLPDFTITFSGSDLICDGTNRVLTANPIDANFTYQWFEKDAGSIGAATTTTLTVDETGEYYFEAQSIPFPACPAAESVGVPFRVVNLPTVAFTAPPVTCEDMEVTFTNGSTLDPEAGANFLWDFGDGSTSTATSPVHAFATIADFNVKLVAAYRGNACAGQLIKSINVGPLPTATITTPEGVFQFCPGGSLTLGASNTFTSYLWSTGATTLTIDVTTGATYNVRLTNSIGCFIQPSQLVTLLEAPVVTASADPALINIGLTSTLTATPGLSGYTWTPAETLDNAGIASPVASPQETTTYTVVGTGTNGCTAEAEVTVEVTFEDIVGILNPGNFISPNGDAFNDTWEVGSITSFPQCGVKIYNEEGAKVFEALPYLNDWDALLNGKPLPNGEYFYFIHCEGESQSKNGSVTVIR